MNNQLAKKVYQDNKKKGFWDKERPVKEILVLIESEAMEALESHRKGRFCTRDLDAIIYETDFKQFVKDTYQDEIADCVIRLLDFAGGFDIDIDIDNIDIDLEEDNVPCQLYDFTELVKTVRNDHSKVNDCLAYLFALAQSQKIDLIEHVHLKLEYNRGRAYKHGKQY